MLPTLLALSLSACLGNNSPPPITDPGPIDVPELEPELEPEPKVVLIELEDFVETGGSTFDDDNFNAGFQTFSNVVEGETTGGIAWNQNQDWGEYNVDFEGSATYQLEIRAAVPAEGDRNVRIYVDGYIVGSGPLTSTGDWSTYEVQSVADDLVIHSGKHVVRVESYGLEWQWNADWIRLTPIGLAPEPTDKPPVNDIPAPDVVKHLEVEGNERVYIAHLPKGYETGEKRPLVIMFHGGGGTANSGRFLSQFNTVSDKYGPVVIYPHSLETPVGPNGEEPTRLWDGFFAFDLGGFYDVEYVQAVVAEAIDLYNVDPAKIFISGNSNGGLFVAGLICNIPDLFAGAATNVATQIVPEVDLCELNPPMPIITSNGTEDETFPYEGDGGILMGIQAANEVYATRNGCDLTPILTEMADIDPDDGSTVTKVEYQNCDAELPVVHYRINNGGHHWPGANITDPVGSLNQDIDWSDIQWKFFQDIIDKQ